MVTGCRESLGFHVRLSTSGTARWQCCTTPAHIIQPPSWLPLAEASFESTAGTLASGHFAAFANSSAHATPLSFPEGAPPWNSYHDYSHMIYDEPVARQDPHGRASRPEGVDSSLGCPISTLPRTRAGHPSTATHDSSSSTAKRFESRTHGVAIAPKPEFLRNVKAQDPRESMTGCIGKVRRRKFGHDERQKVNKVRKQGACLRCRVYKLSVHGLVFLIGRSLADFLEM
ncbi:hypothetical protein LIA77_04711 [Sarocladium implicatum]|nr:hypothetical protein LIA77_04711 [Sarocladium implicatum]